MFPAGGMGEGLFFWQKFWGYVIGGGLTQKFRAVSREESGR
jgi:hypothetical protein